MTQYAETQPYDMALQALSGAIVVGRRNGTGRTDGRRRVFRRLSAFSAAREGRFSAPPHLWVPGIHNLWLSIPPSDWGRSSAVSLPGLARIPAPVCLCTGVFQGSGTLPESRHPRQERHAGEWRVPPVGCNLDRAGYTRSQRRRGDLNALLRLPSRRLGPSRTPGPVKVGARNGSFCTSPAVGWKTRSCCPGRGRGASPGALYAPWFWQSLSPEMVDALVPALLVGTRRVSLGCPTRWSWEQEVHA